MRYQEFCFSAFVLSTAIAFYDCRHSRNMRLRRAGSSPIVRQQSEYNIPWIGEGGFKPVDREVGGHAAGFDFTTTASLEFAMVKCRGHMGGVWELMPYCSSGCNCFGALAAL